MSRSHHHTPITGITTCKSEKVDKQLANRRLRKRINQLVKLDPAQVTTLVIEDLEDDEPGLEDLTPIFPVLREVSNVWSFGKDGKAYRGEEWFEDYQQHRK